MIFSQNMDDLDRQVQNLESVHSLIPINTHKLHFF